MHFIIQYFFLTVVTTLWCIAIHLAGADGMIFEKVSKFFGESKIGKPVITCLYCMASLHTIFTFSIYFGLVFPPGHWSYLTVLHVIGLYLFVATAVSVMNGLFFGIIANVLSKEPAVGEYDEDAEDVEETNYAGMFEMKLHDKSN